MRWVALCCKCHKSLMPGCCALPAVPGGRGTHHGHRGHSILCDECNQLVGCTEFEKCAGSSLRRPTQFIYNSAGRNLQVRVLFPVASLYLLIALCLLIGLYFFTRFHTLQELVEEARAMNVGG